MNGAEIVRAIVNLVVRFGVWSTFVRGNQLRTERTATEEEKNIAIRHGPQSFHDNDDNGDDRKFNKIFIYVDHNCKLHFSKICVERKSDYLLHNIYHFLNKIRSSTASTNSIGI